MTRAVRLNALRIAAEMMGADELAARLRVPAETLEVWLAGHATMPERKFHMLIDALSDASPSQPVAAALQVNQRTSDSAA